MTSAGSARRAGFAIRCRVACEDFGNAVMISLRKGCRYGRPVSLDGSTESVTPLAAEYSGRWDSACVTLSESIGTGPARGRTTAARR